MHQKRARRIILVLIGILALAAVIASFMLFKKNSATSERPAFDMDEYRSEDPGIRFLYPHGFLVEELRDTDDSGQVYHQATGTLEIDGHSERVSIFINGPVAGDKEDFVSSSCRVRTLFPKGDGCAWLDLVEWQGVRIMAVGGLGTGHWFLVSVRLDRSVPFDEVRTRSVLESLGFAIAESLEAR